MTTGWQNLLETQYQIRRSYVIELLRRNGWSLTRAATAEGLALSSLQRIIKSHGLNELYSQYMRQKRGA